MGRASSETRRTRVARTYGYGDLHYTPWYWRKPPVHQEPEEEEPVTSVDSSNEELRSLLQRQKLELEELQRRHREEVAALCRLLSNSAQGSVPSTSANLPYPYNSNNGGHHGSLEGYSTAPQSPDPSTSRNTSRVGSPSPSSVYFLNDASDKG